MDSESNIDRLPLILTSDAGKNYFQFHINGQLASLEYRMVDKDRMALVQLGISKYLDQTEIGHVLIERVMDYAHRADFMIFPICPEVIKYLRKNPMYHKLLASDNQSITDCGPKSIRKTI